MSIPVRYFICVFTVQVRIQRGGRVSGNPGKSQVIWVSIENKQLTPLPLEKVGPPPPPPGKCWTPSEP